MIEVRDLRFAYGGGEFVLAVPALRIEAGERVAFVGPSGSGKTTLVHLVAGILVPESGVVRCGEVEVSALADRERRAFRIREIGMVFQQFELLDYLSARDNVLLPYHVSPALGLDADVRRRADRLADETGIGAVMHRRPARLSQGERQRVAICRALVTEPRLIIADEPTGNLDPRTSSVILDLLFELCERRGATLVVVTHDVAILPRFDRVVDMASLTASEATP